MPAADKESQRTFESPPTYGIWQQQMRPPSIQESPGTNSPECPGYETKFIASVSFTVCLVPAEKSMQTAAPGDQAQRQQKDKRVPPGASSPEQPHTAVSDFFPAEGEDPEAYYYEPDRLLVPEEDYAPDAETEPPSAIKIRTDAECSLPPQDTVIPVRRRIRNKSTPHIKHIMQANKITIAHATPPPTSKTTQAVITHQKALITRGDLVATSKYYKCHKSLGHTPQNIQQVAGTHKRRLLAESGLPAQMHTKVFLVQDKSII